MIPISSDPIIQNLKKTFDLEDLSFNWDRMFTELKPDLEIDGRQFFGPKMVWQKNGKRYGVVVPVKTQTRSHTVPGFGFSFPKTKSISELDEQTMLESIHKILRDAEKTYA